MIVYLLRQVVHFLLCISTHGNIIKTHRKTAY